MSEVKETPVPNTFDFGLSEETANYFGGGLPSVEPDANLTQPAVTSIKRMIDLGGEQVEIEAANEEEFLKAALERQRTYDREQALLNQGDDYDIPEPTRYEPLPDPTEDDIAAILLKLPKDPVGAIAEAMAYATGMTPDRWTEMNQKFIAMENQAYGDAVGRKFMQKHLQFDSEGYVVGGDYYPTPENAKKIIKYMETQNLDFTPQNFEYAFQETKQYLKPFPADYFADSNNTQEVRTAPTAIGSDISSSQSVGQNAGQTEAEIEEMFNKMSPKEFEAWANARRRY